MLFDVQTLLSLPPLVYVVLALTLVLIIKSWTKTPSNLPPCPVRPYPFVGHIPYMKEKQKETMMEWRKKAGDIFTLYVGKRINIVINDFDILKETLVKQADIFSDRPTTALNSLVAEGSRGIIGSSGPVWKEQRSVSLSILRNFGMGKATLAEKIQEEVLVYMDELSKGKDKPQEVRTLTNVAVSNIICSIIIGKRFEYDDSYFINLIHILNEQVQLVKSVSFLSAFSWLKYIPGDLFGAKTFMRNNEELNDHFSNPFIQKFSKKFENDDDAVSFITYYLKAMKQKETSKEPTTMEISQLRRVIQNLFVAGSETTSSTILWFMLYMLHYPDVQKKIFKEINDNVGTERLVSLQDKSKLNYLNAAIKETQRIASIVPFSLNHMCTVDVNVRGYTIPAGATIMPNLDSVLLDEKIWGDPKNFRPERFLDNKGNLLQREEFIPFSLGRRICLGESLAKMELFLFISAIVQKFELLPARPNNLPPLKYVFGVTCPPAPYEIQFVERRSQ